MTVERGSDQAGAIANPVAAAPSPYDSKKNCSGGRSEGVMALKSKAKTAANAAAMSHLNRRMIVLLRVSTTSQKSMAAKKILSLEFKRRVPSHVVA